MKEKKATIFVIIVWIIFISIGVFSPILGEKAVNIIGISTMGVIAFIVFIHSPLYIKIKKRWFK